jgi:hypothetical protein
MDLKEKRRDVALWLDMWGCPFNLPFDGDINRIYCTTCHAIVGLQPFPPFHKDKRVKLYHPTCPCTLLGVKEVIVRAKRFLEETKGE